jgi:hypothetical protein
MTPHHSQRLTWVLALSLCLLACGTGPSPLPTTPPQAQLQFVDLQGFDRDLAGSLSAPLPRVEVAFYDRIVPSAMPERLQHWMAAVEAGGGKVSIVPAKSTLTPKNPFLIVSALSSLWTASKVMREASTEARFKTAQSFDAEIILKQDVQGESVVDKLVFVQRKR